MRPWKNYLNDLTYYVTSCNGDIPTCEESATHFMQAWYPGKYSVKFSLVSREFELKFESESHKTMWMLQFAHFSKAE